MSAETKFQPQNLSTVALPCRMTYEEFLNCPDIESPAEWVGGEVILMTPLGTQHQRLVGFLYMILNSFLEAHPVGEVFFSPIQMKTGPDLAGREPDLVFISSERAGQLKEKFLDGPADLAVEIISPESRRRDRVEKFSEYERGGVREYWLIDPLQNKVDFYALNASGKYEPISVGDDQVMRSRVLDGFWIKVDWLWQQPLPRRMEIVKQWETA